MRVVFAGGGTGGHIFPAVAVIEALRNRVPELEPLFILGSGGRGGKFLDESGVRWETVPVRGMPRRNPLALIPFGIGVLFAVIRSLALLVSRRPRVVVAMGGYASTPVAAAAAILRIPVLVAEQNMIPGIATKWNARLARRIFLAFDEARSRLPSGKSYVVTGNPIRESILHGDREQALIRWELDRDRLTVLIVGGSQGARSLNKLIREMIERWERSKEVQFLFQTGTSDYESIRDSCSRMDVLVRTVPFLADMGDAYGVADLVVCRAGATTLSELTALGLPSILVPFPWSSDGHQSLNAAHMAKRGAAVHIEESDLNPNLLFEAINGLLTDENRRNEMALRSAALGRPEAAETIADSILAVMRRGREREDREDVASRAGSDRSGG